MVNDADITEVGRSERHGDAVRPVRPSDVALEDLRPIRFSSLEHFADLSNRFATLDIKKQMDVQHFVYHLTQARDAWFVETGDVGLVYLTEVRPRFNAQLHVVFWDKRFRGDVVRSVLKTAFDLFELRRISAITSSAALRDKLSGKVGMMLEGTIRQGWAATSTDDAYLLGVLASEAQAWPETPMLLTSSE